jgi:uncharacterized protein (DUF2342 family)
MLEGLGTPAASVALDRPALQRRVSGQLDEVTRLFSRLTGETPQGLRDDLRITDRAGIARRLGDINQELTGAGPTPHPAVAWLQKKVSAALAGMMSQGVLGLYVPEWQSPRGRGLYVVADNIERIAASAGVNPGHLLEHVVAHEAVHQWQDRAHPWLGQTLLELKDAAVQGIDIRALINVRGDITQVSPAMRQMNAVMALMEGHAEFMANAMLTAAGRNHGVGAKLDARREVPKGNALEQFVMTITGMAGKLRQYGAGLRFSEEVAAAGGMALLQRVWDGPANLPTADELEHPERWIARMQPGSAAVRAA